MNIQIIKYDRQTIALVFRHRLRAKGVNFLTPHNYTLQLGLIEHSAGKLIRDHIHRQDIKYKVDTTQEFLYIEKGKVRITLYNNHWQKIKAVILKKGDFILFVSGGHGLKILSECRIIEIKQGPYPGDKRAKIFRDEARN